MDPFRSSAFQNTKGHQTQSPVSLASATTSRGTEAQDMPAPPAYHMVVDPHAPSSHVHHTSHVPYTHPDTHDASKDDCDSDCDDVPEITINAATQIRGTGNIVSIAQMDSIRIASLIAKLLKGGDDNIDNTSSPPSPPQSPPTQAEASSSPLATLANLASAAASSSKPSEPLKERRLPRMNITLNCGATIIGDRNIVGPGLGDIARQMQVAQRNQAVMMQQRQQQQQVAVATGTTGMTAAKLGTGVGVDASAARKDTLYQAHTEIAQHHGLAGLGVYGAAGMSTPPMSRSGSFDEVKEGLKRGREWEDEVESATKRRC